jgi:hypothetical protein
MRSLVRISRCRVPKRTANTCEFIVIERTRQPNRHLSQWVGRYRANAPVAVTSGTFQLLATQRADFTAICICAVPAVLRAIVHGLRSKYWQSETPSRSINRKKAQPRKTAPFSLHNHYPTSGSDLNAVRASASAKAVIFDTPRFERRLISRMKYWISKYRIAN